jgi:nucleotide-binding universal stress UspA family protein
MAEELAKEEAAEVILIRAVLAHPLPFTDAIEAEVKVMREGEAYLESIADRLERRGLKSVHWSAWYDEPANAITEAAKLNRADLIAMATHGRGGLSRLLLGSVAEAVVRTAQVPVLLLRGQSAWKPWVTGKVLVPLDGFEPSEGILPVVERLAWPRDLGIFLLEVIEPLPSAAAAELGGYGEEITAFRREEAERYLAKVAEPLKAQGLNVEWDVKTGQPAQVIAAMAAREPADLIAMVTHGRKGLGRLCFGSVAEGVLRSASVPVLLLRAADSDW